MLVSVVLVHHIYQQPEDHSVLRDGGNDDFHKVREMLDNMLIDLQLKYREKKTKKKSINVLKP